MKKVFLSSVVVSILASSCFANGQYVYNLEVAVVKAIDKIVKLENLVNTQNSLIENLNNKVTSLENTSAELKGANINLLTRIDKIEGEDKNVELQKQTNTSSLSEHDKLKIINFINKD